MIKFTQFLRYHVSVLYEWCHHWIHYNILIKKENHSFWFGIVIGQIDLSWKLYIFLIQKLYYLIVFRSIGILHADRKNFLSKKNPKI